MRYVWHGHWVGFFGTGHWVSFFFFLTLYFLPSIIAAIRGAKHGVAIGVLNLLLGWTVVGWIAILIWAVAERPSSPR